MTKEIKVQLLPAEKFGRVDVRDDGSVIVTVVVREGEEFGFLLPDEVAEEMTGALIERSPQSLARLGEPTSPDDADFHVTSVEVLAPEGEQFVLRLSAENGPALTFRMGARQVRRWRDALTAQVARQQFRHRQ